MPLIPPSAPGAAQRDFRPRFLVMAGVATVGFLVLAVRLYQLQILRGDEYKGKADENFVKELRVPADRGFIMDRSRKVLVDSRPSYDVFITPYFCGKQCDETIARLRIMLSLSPEDVARVQEHARSCRGLVRFRPFPVKVDITRDELDVFEANRLELAGVDVQPTPHRNYRYGNIAGHLLGYMNEIGPEEIKEQNEQIEEDRAYQLGDYIGRRGLERRWENELRGVDGKYRVVVDAKGNLKSPPPGSPQALGGEASDFDLIPKEEQVEPSKPGHNLLLSIDWRLQEFAEKTFPAQAGVVIAMDPKTGFILALADRPSPDPNKLSGRISGPEMKALHDDPLKPELFRAIQAHYPPGSTFKLVTSVAALEEGALKLGGTVSCPGRYTMGGHTWRCDKEAGHGAVDLTHALGASCDVFYYALGDRLGVNKLARWANALGYGKPTGFDIAGEIPGIMADEEWHRSHTGFYQHGFALNEAIGQGGVDVTPIQQAVAYAAVANGGTVWKPQVVLKVEDATQGVLQEFGPVEAGRVPWKKETLEAVRAGLRAAVNEPYGTGYRSRAKDFVMAGKTGTAQVKALGLKRIKAAELDYFDRDHAWFAAFAPFEDPQIVVVVLNEHSGFGASNAAPTASAVVKYYLELLNADELERAGGTAPEEKRGEKKKTLRAPQELPAPAPPPRPEEPDKVKLGLAGKDAARGA
jgi:penicillin-binding protein 2